MNYRITHTTKYSYSEQVPVCHNKVHLAPRVLPHQMVADFQLLVLPEPSALSRQRDYFDNRVDYFTIQEPHSGLSITASSTVAVDPKSNDHDGESPRWEAVVQELRTGREAATLAVYQFAFPSRLIGADGRREEYADYARQSFTAEQQILPAALDLTRRIHEDFAYDPRATTVSTPVAKVFDSRSGVCQDFAQLQIACLRSLGLAARYVSGYLRTIPPPGQERLVGADASHAWLSLYCGSELGWVDLDPTNDKVPDADYITIGWGADYSDVCPIQGIFVGGGQQSMSVHVDVEPQPDG